MIEDLVLNFISKDAIPASLEKPANIAYYWNRSKQKVFVWIFSIYSRNHKAQIILILAMTDQFTHSGQALDVKRVLELIEKLPDEYDYLYFRGLVSEPQARAMLSESKRVIQR